MFLATISLSLLFALSATAAPPVEDSSPLIEKARYFQRDLLEKHWMDGLYISIVPVPAPGQKLRHDVDEPGNVIHSGVWTGRYLAGVGYQYAVTRDPWVRKHGGEILEALRRQQEVTGKPGLLARGHVKGHGPVVDWERDGRDSTKWHQGQGKYADYRFYSDVSVDNFNAVLFGYAVYFDLAADAAQKQFIAYDVDRLMTHLLDNHCRIIDLDGNVTQYGHIGVDPDPSRDEYYKKVYASRMARMNLPAGGAWKPPLRMSLMLLPDLLIAHHITGKQHYLDFYKRVVERFRDNTDPMRQPRGFSLERLARVNHSSEGQAYEALYNLIRYEHDPKLLEIYRPWVEDLWDMNWMEGNPLYTYMSVALLPGYKAPSKPGVSIARTAALPHSEESLKLSLDTLRLFPVDRVFRPVMNSLRKDIELNPSVDRGGAKQSTKPVPINQRPLDNEYSWKGNPYDVDGWLKPAVVAMAFACDDPLVAWFADDSGRIFMTRDWKHWSNMSSGLMGAKVSKLAASTTRTFVLHAQTDKGVYLTRDGGMSWLPATETEAPRFPESDFHAWLKSTGGPAFRVGESGELLRSADGGASSSTAMQGWRIPLARSVFQTPRGVLAAGPGGAYLTTDGAHWTELKLWNEEETGAADYLHAYWMGRYYGLVPER